MMRKWLGCLLVAGAVGVTGCGTEEAGGPEGEVFAVPNMARDGWDGKDRDGKDKDGKGRHDHDDGYGKNECREVEKICKTINSYKNITQVFLEVPKCFDKDAISKVVVFDKWDREQETIDWRDLKKKGGPCKEEIERDFWFPLTGKQSEAKVCVFFEPDGYDKIPEDIAIGFKAGGKCEEDRYADLECKSCERKHDHHDGKCDCKDKDGKGKDGKGKDRDHDKCDRDHKDKKCDGKGKDGRGKDRDHDKCDRDHKDKKCDCKGKDGKGKDRDGKGKDGKGKDGKGKDGKGKDGKGKDRDHDKCDRDHKGKKCDCKDKDGKRKDRDGKGKKRDRYDWR